MCIGLGIMSFLQAKTWATDETLLKRSLAIEPDNVPARTSLAALYAQAGDLESEAAVLREGQSVRENVAYLLGIGSVEARRGNTVAARTLYEEARLMDDGNPEPLFYLGALAEQEGKISEAISLYEQAVAMDLSYVAPMINLGAIHMDAERYEDAIVWFTRAIAWNPNLFEARYNLGTALETLRRNEEAFPHFKAAYQLNPLDGDIATTYAYRLFEKGENDRARAVIDRYLATDPTHRTALRLKDLINAK